MAKTFKLVEAKDLVKGKNYYDVDDLDYGLEFEFIKKTSLYLHFKPLRTQKFYKKVDKHGIIKFSRIMLGFKAGFYEFS